MENKFKNLKILYVEEVEDIQSKTLNIFNKYINDIVVESSILKALETINKNQFDLIVTEIDFSNNNGIDFIEKIREYDYWIPIVIVTNLLSSNYLLPCINLNIQGYIQKPLDELKIENFLTNILKYKKQVTVDKIKLDEDVYYDCINYLIEKEEEKIVLNKKERLLLDLLLENKNKVVSYKNIETIIWYYDDKVMTQDALKNVIKSLRKKISKDIIKNVSGLGYKIIIKF